MEILWVLGIPLAGGLLLALLGSQRWAAELNVALSLATFAAAVSGGRGGGGRAVESIGGVGV